MKTTFAVILAVLASANAFAPLATRAVGKKKVAKKPVKRVVKKAASAGPPASKGYPSFKDAAESFKPWTGISGGGNRAPTPVFLHPESINPDLQFDRDPAAYEAAAKTRTTKNQVFVFDDGLTELERKQRKTIPTFLTGSAKSQADTSTIRSDLSGEEFAFGLDADRFQLLFITVFGLFTLVGCLSGNVNF
uniref:PSI-J n=1 Tax=Grammatophora oceanica TaxID=210454 RepID=A0A7S1Y4M3_9STRA|mmetsp:Transcript_25573/g.37387  ORF Transcript_25573/g.37387 Transcript_25573/m.37387 type:complete len:191 (+) Transcript_25573:68-640(+)|eukprot:CAMPEP_0194026158 /NCGR_PEP_ID=MMETSP0009_2-20130614/472_1 /TAXON_ID=210454 /ORGANISM="Grammatophora oceanica, Strain CCMP 410" /LENGTH=190 /DNA_ID=CAMNT_0038664707 /DNA_START=58 /DNA_END=630 /DNA_ORIENTATION=+